jgi:hypothetical protein
MQDRVMMLYPSGCLNPITLHIYSIMFTSRSSTLHSAFRVAGFVRAGLTALPQIIQLRSDSLRSMSCLVRLPLLGDLCIQLLVVLLRYLIL